MNLIIFFLTLFNCFVAFQVWIMHRQYIVIFNEMRELLIRTKNFHNHLSESLSRDNIEKVLSELRQEQQKGPSPKC